MQNMTAQIKAWGNGNALRLNKEILAMLGLKTNDKVDLEVEDNKLIITPKKRLTLEEMFENYKGSAESYEMPDDLKDWLNMKPVGREWGGPEWED